LETRQVISTLKARVQELENSAEIAVKEQQEKQGAVGYLADKKKEHVSVQCDIIHEDSVGRSETEELAKRNEIQTARRNQKADTESASQKAPDAAEASWKVGSAVDAYLECLGDRAAHVRARAGDRLYVRTDASTKKAAGWPAGV